MKPKILIVEDAKYWDEIPRLKKIGYAPFGNMSDDRFEIKVVHSIENIDDTIESFKPQLISFNAVVLPDGWYEVLNTLDKKNMKVVTATYYPLKFPQQTLIVSGVKDFFCTLKPDQLLTSYAKLLSKKKYRVVYPISKLYWGIRANYIK